MFLQTAIDKIFGSKNERALKHIRPRLAGIEVHDAHMKGLSDSQLSAFRRLALQ